MPKPICVNCKRFFRPKQNGVLIAENMPKTSHAIPNMPKTSHAIPGTFAPEQWVPYKVWEADLWECHGCGNEIVVGFGHAPVSIQHMEGFPKWFDRTTVTVNDC